MAVQKFLKEKLASVLTGAVAGDTESVFDIGSIDAVHIVKGIGIAVLSGILGGSGGVFSCYPFGIAYLCTADRYVYFSYFGLLMSALANRGYALPLAVIYTVILMLRYAVGRLMTEGEAGKLPGVFERIRGQAVKGGGCPGVFSESLLIRVSVACFAAFIFGLYRLIAGGFLYYDLFGLLAGFIISPLAAVALGGLFTNDERFVPTAAISRGALVFLVVFSLREFVFMGFSLGFMAAFFITVWVASSVGGLKGCAVGLLLGLACGTLDASGAQTALAAYSVGTAPCIMAAAGLFMGALLKISRAAAVAAACAVGISLGLIVDGYGVLPRLLPDIVVAAAAFIPLSRFGFLPRLVIFSDTERTACGEESSLLEKKQADTAARMSALSEAFSHLSDTIYSLSDRMRRPGVADLKQVCDSAFEGFCQKCAMQSVCLERECLTTLDAQSKITGALYKAGRVEIEDVPQYFRDRCFNILPVIDEINISTAKLIEQLIKNDKTEAFALDYEAMSKLLAAQIDKNDAEYKVDNELTKKLRKSLKYMGISAESALCCGSRKKQAVISGVDAANIKMGAREIRRAVENTLEVPMDSPIFNIEDGIVTVSLEARRRYKTEVAKATSIKESESANGDSIAVFENKEDYFYALISDGMGSGREAAITSKICAVFLERMLSAGNAKHITLEMLNGFIRSRACRGSECSATIDLAEIDLINGKASFIKSGAAPSFVLRGGNLYKLQSKTLPIGIMHELDAEKIGFELVSGDVIIMLSDGVAQSLEDGVWLANLLTYEWEDDIDIMAAKILDNAVLTNKRSDDMSVAVIRISENEGE